MKEEKKDIIFMIWGFIGACFLFVLFMMPLADSAPQWLKNVSITTAQLFLFIGICLIAILELIVVGHYVVRYLHE